MTKTISTKISRTLYEKLEKRVEDSEYNNISDFLRQVIREKLEGE